MKTETTKMWNLFVNDLILVKDQILEVIEIIDGVERLTVIAKAENGSKHIFENTVYKRVIKC